MLRNYITVAIRNLLRQKGFAIINILGLTIGLTVSALIILYIVHEMGYDRFHENSTRIYRVAIDGEISGQPLNVAVSSPPFGPNLTNDYPEIANFTRIDHAGSTALFAIGDEKFYEHDVLYVDSSFFELFTVPFIIGDPESALKTSRSIVLTESTARKYFGEENAMGKTMRYNDQYDLTVTGICKDYPKNSHLEFNALISFATRVESSFEGWLEAWGNLSIWTYIMLEKNARLDSLEAKLPEFLPRYFAEEIETSNIRLDPYLQPITSIHLHSNLMAEIGPNSDINYIYLMMSITLFILILASINFMNLSTAKSSNRAREVGVRKVLGANKQSLVIQFIGESVIISLISLFITLFLIELILPTFNNITGKDLDMQYILDWQLTLGFILLALIVGVFAGSYPAFYLSAFNPVRVLKGRIRAGSSNSLLRNTLVFIQFTISIALIIGTVIIYRQLEFIKNKNLGFDKENVVVFTLRNPETRRKAAVIKDEFLKQPDITGVSLTTGWPGGTLGGTGYFPEGYGDEDPWLLYGFSIDQDFIDKTARMTIVEGRNFSAEFASDSTAVLINETLMRQLDWTEDPIGRIISSDNTDSTNYRVIGVLGDFHNQSLHSKINPVMLRFLDGNPRFILVRIRETDPKKVLAQLELSWKEINPEIPFDYTFIDEQIDEFYEFEEKIGKIFIYFTLFAMLIAALGLYGLATYISEQRTKEIGIRKAMGSSVSKISYILSKDFAKPVLLANLFAWPLAWFTMKQWLQNFEYQTDMSLNIVWIFLLAGFLALVLALITVNIQTIRAASSNPVDALRYE
ncbi:MAG TPA: FtsX-like permease family protein [Bacteroides sp.]|nr:FtsX-like permease family protein [Bacteroides sp.]